MRGLRVGLRRAAGAALVAAAALASAPLVVAQEAAAGTDPSRVVGAPRGTPLAGEALAARTEEVAGVLRCPVCQGLSVADSPATMAVSMKAQVKDLLAQGYDQEQILAYFENSYGEFVRLEPPLRGVNWLVWLGPVIALAAGGAFVSWTLRGRRRAGGRGGAVAAARPRHAARRPRARAPRAARPRAGLRLAGRPSTRSVRLMPPAEVQWQPALVVLVSGLVLGALLVVVAAAPWRAGRDRGAGGPVARAARPRRPRGDAAAAAARARRRWPTKRTPEQLARERYALELEAAHALQARDALAPRPVSAPAPSRRRPRAAPPAVSCGASRAPRPLGLLLLFVWQSAERRPEGGSVTGTTPGAGSGGSASGAPGGAPSPAGPEDARTVELRAALARNPEDHDAAAGPGPPSADAARLHGRVDRDAARARARAGPAARALVPGARAPRDGTGRPGRLDAAAGDRRGARPAGGAPEPGVRLREPRPHAGSRGRRRRGDAALARGGRAHPAGARPARRGSTA